METTASKRPTLVSYASIFGVDILPEETSLEASVDDMIAFMRDIETLELEGVSPAADFDPAWPRVNETRS